MRAAIYARRSKEQLGTTKEQTSVERQKELAREYAKVLGWTVLDDHVYEDDGISGAEFEARPGLMRMMGALTPRPPFSVLIVSEQKSLGREMSQTMYVLKQLAEAGVEVWGYAEQRCLTPKNWLDKAVSVMRSAADEAHREDTSVRVKETFTRKFKRGDVVGGRVFGYRNVDVMKGTDEHGRPLRSHVTREIIPEEAAVVRRIFELYDSGLGFRTIAHQLNSEGAITPKPFKRKDLTKVRPNLKWTPGLVRSILNRELYRGVAVWNRSQKRTSWGKVNQRMRDRSEWLYAPFDKNLQIIDDDLWNRVAARRADTAGNMLRFNSGRLSGRPPKHGANNLLAGLALCSRCGGGLGVETSGRKNGRVAEYVCHRHRHSGNTVCQNARRIKVDTLNEAILQAIESHVLTPEAVEAVVLLTERDDNLERQKALEREAKSVERRIANLVSAIADGGDDLASLKAKVRELETRKLAIADERASLRPVPRLAPAVIESALEQWRRLLRSSITQGRAVLQRVLVGRITFTPRADGGYDFHATTRYDKLFSGVVVERPVFVKVGTRGTEHIGSEDTFEGDYGRLLARAQQRYGQCLASPTGFEPVFQP